MTTRKLIIFEHDTALGGAPSHELFEAVEVVRRPEVSVARDFSDYEVQVHADIVPEGITVRGA